MTNNNRNHIIIRYEDLSDEKQLEVDDILEVRAQEQVEDEVNEGIVDKDYAMDRVQDVISEMSRDIWVELEV